MLHRALVLGLVALLTAAASAQAAPKRFPADFLWGTASAGFQSEAGGTPAHADRGSDWWAFTTARELIEGGVVSGDQVTDGPGGWSQWRTDLELVDEQLGANAIRLGLEWSRIFPRSTTGVDTGTRISQRELRALDRLADQGAVRHYARVLRGAKRRGLTTMLTLNHYVLPRWVHDPLAVRAAFAGVGADGPVPEGLRQAGWLDPTAKDEFRKLAAYAAWKLGDRVDLWATLNEPLITVSQGYVSIPGVTGVKAPAILNYPAALRVVEQLGLANAAAYDAIKSVDRRATVGFVHNMIAWRPADPASAADRTAAKHADAIFNRAWLDLAIKGDYDVNANGTIDPGERRPHLQGKADFIGVNHYSPGTATALPAPVSAAVPLFDFAPTVAYRGTANPNGPPCPTRCSDFGWPIDPSAFRDVLEQAAAYDLPIYVTENGIDDAGDDQRPGYIRGYVKAMHQAIARGADVRGYFHWSLTDNYEWAEGFHAHFGLYGYDPRTLERTPRRTSVELLRRIARANALPGG